MAKRGERKEAERRKLCEEMIEFRRGGGGDERPVKKLTHADMARAIKKIAETGDIFCVIGYVDQLERLAGGKFWHMVCAAYDNLRPDPPKELIERFSNPDMPLSRWPVKYDYFLAKLGEIRHGNR